MPRFPRRLKATVPSGRSDGRPFHLRACGEHGRNGGNVAPTYVSPPRLRRTWRASGATRWCSRFTSAPAENMSELTFPASAFAFHLRACGEHPAVAPATEVTTVSPPRLRRTSRADPAYAYSVRFTSAPAENMQTPWRPGSTPAFHLRACGEHCVEDVTRLAAVVSPPRLRRTFPQQVGTQTPAGFTSAPAENISTRCWPGCGRSFHLRACGEHFATAESTYAGLVSPPRLRRT